MIYIYIYLFFYLGQYVPVLDNVFVGGEQNVELPTTKLRYQVAAQVRGALS